MQFSDLSFSSKRSNLIARQGMVATSQPLAAQAGLNVLRAGGNAIDAAIATVATLCVVEPTSTGIGGDAFAMIWIEAEKKLYGLNASGPAPAALTRDLILSRGHDSMPVLGPLAVTVPGSLRGWELALERFGTSGLDTLLQDPISYAERGFPVSEHVAYLWARQAEKMSKYPDSARVWLPGGRAPRHGEIFQNAEFAETLKTIAQGGVDEFYKGSLAEQISLAVQEAGGVLSASDLAAYRARWDEPLSVQYRNGYNFFEMPPNGQGLAALLAFNIARGLDLYQYRFDSAQRIHLMLEAMKLGFVDAQRYVGDPDRVDVPIKSLLSDNYTESRRKLINREVALMPQAGVVSKQSDTVYLSVADGNGNMVSWIQSNYMGFGSGLTAGRTGIALQNRAANFCLDLNHPNCVAPGKRPFHTIIPGFITFEGEAFASYGVMGGHMQPQGHLQVGLNLIDLHMSPQAALDAPRFHWIKDRQVALESEFHAALRPDLARFGHEIMAADQVHFGGAQVILRDTNSGTLIGGTERRNDGIAVGY